VAQQNPNITTVEMFTTATVVKCERMNLVIRIGIVLVNVISVLVMECTVSYTEVCFIAKTWLTFFCAL